MGRVFVSGGTGFIAAHIIDTLLERGHSVVTSVRSQAKGENILKNHPGVGKDQLDYAIVEDIADPTAFDEVIKSDPPFEYVLHTSSPFHFNVTDVKKDLLDPAIIGTTGILKAIKKSAPSVKRVVVTSSFAAIVNATKGNWPEHTYSEEDWNPITVEQATANPSSGYRASKTLAEKAAWEFVEKEKPNFDLATINPPLVFGPIFPWLQTLDSLNTSNQRMTNLLTGKAKASGEIPKTGLPLWVDVRDVALAHVKAIEVDEAGGKRYFTVEGYFSHTAMNDIMRDNFPEYDNKLLPKGTKGDDYVEGAYYKYDNSRVKGLLGQDLISFEKCVIDTVKSLKEIGA